MLKTQPNIIEDIYKHLLTVDFVQIQTIPKNKFYFIYWNWQLIYGPMRSDNTLNPVDEKLAAYFLH